MSTYGIITTYADSGSRNVGDNLISQSAKSFISDCCSEGPEFVTYWRDQDFSDKITSLNELNAIFFPGFAIREPLDETYPILKHVGQLSTPLVPLGTGWKDVPGALQDSLSIEYTDKTVEYLRKISENVEVFGVREYLTKNALANNGVNSELVGDCAWYDLDSIGKSLTVPTEVSRVVLTTPHSDRYVDQAKMVASMLANMFPAAELICSLHSVPTRTENQIADHCAEIGYDVRDVSGDISNIKFYEGCDLHVGYRVHGHIAFLRKRQPSVLLNEDGRGVGFSYTFGTGGFDAFYRRGGPSRNGIQRALEKSKPVRGIRSLLSNCGYKRHDSVPPDQTVVNHVERFIDEEIGSGFQRYRHIPDLIDSTYNHRMRPLVENHVD